MWLKKITFACGGKCYLPKTIDWGLGLFEVSTIISVAKRPKIDWTLVKKKSMDIMKFHD